MEVLSIWAFCYQSRLRSRIEMSRDSSILSLVLDLGLASKTGVSVLVPSRITCVRLGLGLVLNFRVSSDQSKEYLVAVELLWSHIVPGLQILYYVRFCTWNVTSICVLFFFFILKLIFELKFCSIVVVFIVSNSYYGYIFSVFCWDVLCYAQILQSNE